MLRWRPKCLYDVKSVYSMSASEVRAEIRKASKSRVSSAKHWDALMYRTSVISRELSLSDISVILDSISAFPKYQSKLFVKCLLDRIDKKLLAHSSPTDLSMVLRNVVEMQIFTELELVDFFSKLSPSILAKLDSSCARLVDLERVASVVCRFRGSEEIRAKISKTVLSKVTLGKESVKVLTNLLNCLVPGFARWGEADMHIYEDEQEPFFQATPTPLHVPAVGKLLNACIEKSNLFSHTDILVFASAVARIPLHSLAELGHPTIVPIAALISRLISKERFQFKPSEITQLICLSHTVRFPIDVAPLLSEFIYKIRDFRPANCVRIWKHEGSRCEKLVEAVTARLLKYDANTTLTGPDLLDVADLVVLTNGAYSGKALLTSLAPNFRRNTDLDLEAITAQLQNANNSYAA